MCGKQVPSGGRVLLGIEVGAGGPTALLRRITEGLLAMNFIDRSWGSDPFPKSGQGTGKAGVRGSKARSGGDDYPKTDAAATTVGMEVKVADHATDEPTTDVEGTAAHNPGPKTFQRLPPLLRFKRIRLIV
jgi:hypothetical protein